MKYLIAVSLFSLSMLYGEDADLLQSPELDIPSESLSSVTPEQIEHVQALAPPELSPQKNITISVLLSALFPGLGHYYLGDMQTGTALSGTAGLGCTLLLSPNQDDSSVFLGANTISLTSCYGIYSVYRDTRRYNGESIYSYKRMPQDSFYDLAMASFKPSILKKPEVWGGFCAALALGTAIGYFVNPEEASSARTASFTSDMLPPYAFFVGISEESLFRGYLQSSFSEDYNPTTGIILSSLLFGAAHIPNAKLLDIKESDRWRYYSFSIPFITAFGAYFGWMTYKNSSLQEAVALHSWYDFTLFTISYLTEQKTGKAMIGAPKQFAFSFSF